MEFMGRMLGKAVYEGILMEPRFAGFFLKHFRPGAKCDVNDLVTLDSELYRHLMSLRHMSSEDLSGLGLTFVVDAATFVPFSSSSSTSSVPPSRRQETAAPPSSSSSSMAAVGARVVHEEVELKPGGRDIAVTGDNVTEYIYRMAYFRLNQQPRAAIQAFMRGFWSLVRPEWVAMFVPEELQLLIGGSEEGGGGRGGGVNLVDLRANVEYAGGYHEDHPIVHSFWDALASLSPEDQRGFLKFVTSCSRAPLLGFRHLHPKLCIQMAGSVLDPSAAERLPTAATCMNLLKLPPYPTTEIMRSKLQYAIQSGAGFDLS